MKKKIILIITLFSIIFFVFIKYNITNNTTFFYKYKNKLSPNIKWNIRIVLTKINSFFVIKKEEFILKKKEEIILKSKNFDNKITIFNNANFIFTGPRAYFGSDDKNLFLITGTGLLMSAKLDTLNTSNENLKFLKINTNIDKFLFEYKKKKNNIHFHTSVVKSILIKDKKVFISIIQKFDIKTNIIHPGGCFKHVILEGNLSLKKINFKQFHLINDCRPAYHDYVGGSLADYKNDKILYTVGDFAVCEKSEFISKTNTKYCKKNNAQVVNSALGKIFIINLKNKSKKIISLGHDNPQGIYYDKVNNVIYSTEHGPQGGDEININIKPSTDNVKNYGYPISSYGEHYGFPDKEIMWKYNSAPLHKSHKKYGFVEPADYFVPSIGISPIAKHNNKLFVGALGSNIDEGDLSLHIYDVDKNFNLINHDIFKIYQRIRDIHVIKKINKIFLFFETSGSVAIINL